MRIYSSIVICLLVAYYPCSAHLFGFKNFGLKSSLLFKNEVTNGYPMDVGKFTQKLDHFDPTNNTTWEQRYGVSTKFYKPGPSSPVFLWIDGEGVPFFNLGGAWAKYAEKYGALCLMLEHRYHGESYPIISKSTESLKFLSSQQALADLAYFIEGMNKKFGLTNKNKWIAFGGSYAGSLAAWLRYKYPHLVHGAVSSSAPLLAKADFYEFYDGVRSSLDTYGKNCSIALTEANLELQLLLKSDAGREKVSKLLRSCDKIDGQNKKDVTNLFSNLAGNIAWAVEQNDFYKAMNKSGIDYVCDVLTNHTLGSPLTRYAVLNTQTSEYTNCCSVTKKLNGMGCINYTYSYDVKVWQHEWDARSLIYQVCTEFGFFKTSEKKTSLLGSNIDLKVREDLCADIFGPSISKSLIESGVYRTNTIYGGLNIKATRVVYVHGSIDPWHALGITHSDNEQAPAIFINGTSQCADLYDDSPSDLPQLREARVKISALIGKWLNEQ